MLGLVAAFVTGQSADVITTILALQAGCAEANPLYQGSVLHLVTVKGLVTLVLCAGVGALVRNGHARWARLVLWTGILTAGAAAAWNTYLLPYC